MAKKLTDTAIRTAKPKEKPYKMADSGGLYVLVNPGGGKLWRLKYRFDGKERLFAIGTYPAVSLKEARAQAVTAAAPQGNRKSRVTNLHGLSLFSEVFPEGCPRKSSLPSEMHVPSAHLPTNTGCHETCGPHTSLRLSPLSRITALPSAQQNRQPARLLIPGRSDMDILPASEVCIRRQLSLCL